MLSTIFESLYNKVFVNIVVKELTTEVYIELCSKKGVISHYKESFETVSIEHKMLEFISLYIKESPYYYITILDTSTEQGVIPTCEKNILSRFYDISASEHKCYNGQWSYYTSKTDLYAVEKTYQEIGVDMIFSPFSLLVNFFKDKIESHLAMYILVQDSSIVLVIFEKSQLLYGKYIDMRHEDEGSRLPDLSEEMSDINLSLDDGIDLDEIDVDDGIEDIDELDELDDLDDFADIEDLDSIEDIDEFSKDHEIEEELLEEESTEEESSEDSFNGDYERFTNIKSALRNFYDDEKYESKFIENVYIADNVGVSSDLKRYLEEEMFLSVYVRHIDVTIELAELAKMEIKL